MDKNKKNEELQSRREFFKRAAKGVLPIIGAAVLANAPGIVKAAEHVVSDCKNSCYGTCAGTCKGTCQGECYTTCYNYCKNACKDTCKSACSRSCKGSCNGR